MKYDIQYIRNQFPATKRTVNRLPVAYFDGAAGTQVPQRVVDKMSDYLLNHNANKYGYYATSLETEALLSEARQTIADFLGCSMEEVSFGASSTANTFFISQAIVRDLNPGDEIVITDLDHECNRSPWLTLEERGMVVKSVEIDKEKYILKIEDFASKITPRTKVVAIGHASNAIGTINDVKTVIEMAHAVGALTVVDSVHNAAHNPIDVKIIDTDFLICSGYKFFGPHIGILYTKGDVAKNLRTLKPIPNDDVPPVKFEVGTDNFESICGAAEAVKFIADIGAMSEDNVMTEFEGMEKRRRNIVAGMLAIEQYENELLKYLDTELRQIPELTFYSVPPGYPKTPTIAFSVKNKNSADICKHLAQKGIFVANGHFLATELIINILRLGDIGGPVRVSLAPYNTMLEVERLVEGLKESL